MPHLRSAALHASLVLVTATGFASSAQAAGHRAAHAKSTLRTADLVVRGLDVEVGDTDMEITGSIKNLGFRKATKSDLVIAVSSDRTLDDSDDVLDEVATHKVMPGRARSFDDVVDLPADEDLPDGTVYLLVCADGNEAVAERNETNNCQSLVLADDDADSSDGSLDDGSADPSAGASTAPDAGSGASASQDPNAATSDDPSADDQDDSDSADV